MKSRDQQKLMEDCQTNIFMLPCSALNNIIDNNKECLCDAIIAFALPFRLEENFYFWLLFTFDFVTILLNRRPLSYNLLHKYANLITIILKKIFS